MYIPKHFEETRVGVMHELIRVYPLATLVTHSTDGLNANHIPLHLSESPPPYGTLQGHIARANPLFAEIAEGVETLAIFHGPNSYITPSWYATKKETGKVVPTWNYAAVHAYGTLRIVDNASWLRSQLNKLTNQNEASKPEPWTIADAPTDYIERIMAAIVGIELVITKLLGKWKVGQNQPAQNQVGVIEGLRLSNCSASETMAVFMENVTRDAR